MEETTKSNQLQDKEHSYLRRANRAQYKANNGCFESCETGNHWKHVKDLHEDFGEAS